MFRHSELVRVFGDSGIPKSMEYCSTPSQTLPRLILVTMSKYMLENAFVSRLERFSSALYMDSITLIVRFVMVT